VLQNQRRNALYVGAETGATGNLPGTETSGLILRETVTIERQVSGSWSVVAADVPATFTPAPMQVRVDLASVTHHALNRLWLPEGTPLADQDRVTRSDGARWYVRGAPDTGPGGACVRALVESEAEDGLFGASQSG
jgi:hypothetical protein